MQISAINSLNFKGTNSENSGTQKNYEIAVLTQDTSAFCNSAKQNISSLQNDLRTTKEIAGMLPDKKEKGFFGKIASLLAMFGVTFLLSKKMFNKGAVVIKDIKGSDTFKTVAKKIQEKMDVSSLVSGAKNLKDKFKLPDSLEGTKLVEKFRNMQPENKAGVIGAAVGTGLVTRIDNDKDGKKDLFVQGQNVLDGLSKATKLVQQLL